MAMFSRGHCLLVGVPGLAKTLLVSTVSKILHLTFKRVQFTPDLMPADITGTDILQDDPDTGRRKFTFLPGPIFANMVLADEINRTPPKTQAALLEAMQEHHVTAGGHAYHLPEPFFVLATQNPIEQEGTYPLPEAQLDRFMFNVIVGYPSRAEEIDIMKRTTSTHRPTAGSDAQRRTDPETPGSRAPGRDGRPRLRLRRRPGAGDAAQGPDGAEVHPRAGLVGRRPRACQYLILGGKARALLHGRLHVTTDDIRAVAYPVLRHRLVTTFNADAEGITTDDVVRKLIQAIPLPQEEAAAKVRR